MNKYEVGKLETGMQVMVGGQVGVVTGVHEPEWIDHKTKAFRKELQGADVRFSGDEGCRGYVWAEDITILSNEPRSV